MKGGFAEPELTIQLPFATRKRLFHVHNLSESIQHEAQFNVVAVNIPILKIAVARFQTRSITDEHIIDGNDR